MIFCSYSNFCDPPVQAGGSSRCRGQAARQSHIDNQMSAYQPTDSGVHIPGSVRYIDVRTPEETAAAPFLPASCTVACASVTLEDASAMSMDFLTTNGIDLEASIVVFCRSGRRAGVALTALQSLGCTNAVNGGGIGDVLTELAKANPVLTAADLLKDENSRASVRYIDVRTPEETAAAPFLPASCTVACASVTLEDASAMSMDFLTTNGIDLEAPIVVFCRSGRRAGVALAALQSLGCTKAANGGGIGDVLSLL
jgi:rhodanese-related sulfurtransferase